MASEIIDFEYKFRKPKQLENDVFVIFTSDKVTLNPGEEIRMDTGIKIYLPKYVEGTVYIFSSLRDQGLKLLNSKCISQKYNCNLELKEVYKTETMMPPWKLTLHLQNTSLTQLLTIKKRSSIGFLNLYNVGDETKYRFKKKH